MNKIKVVSDKIKKSVFSVFKGKEDVVDMILCAIYAQGHILLEDVPGTGKTVLAKALAKSIDIDFSRIQCTPDLMPSDITGNNIWLPAKQEFEFRKGPIMSSIVLVDELNRATPRTQSALLECMAENQVSVDGKVHPLEKPFFVIATENPVESEGTFPLPEAQKDRFMLSISIGYPSVEDEIQIITAQNSLVHPVEGVCAVVTKDEIIECMEEVVKVFVDDAVLSYLISLCNWTRTDDRILAGVSPRGSLSFYKACQAYAAIHGRSFVTPEDVKTMALPVFRKRIILKTDSILKGYTEENLVKELLDSIPIPNFKAHV
jgi:MoxR-like ATPase